MDTTRKVLLILIFLGLGIAVTAAYIVVVYFYAESAPITLLTVFAIVSTVFAIVAPILLFVLQGWINIRAGSFAALVVVATLIVVVFLDVRYIGAALIAGAVLGGVIVIVYLIRKGQSYEWTGFGDSKPTGGDSSVQVYEQVQSRKTLWDWLQLFIIPLVLVGIGFAFDVRQQGIEDRRAERERELEAQRAQDEALQAYLDQLSTLLLDKSLRDSTTEGEEARTLARARTLTVLEGLDGDRRSSVLQFLMEASLIQKVDEKQPIINLQQANLENVRLIFGDLSGANLVGANLDGAGLWRFDLSDAVLESANLDNTELMQADLREADLVGAGLSGADLRETDLSGANLVGADLTDADLSGANLETAELYDIEARDLGRDFRGTMANLTDADLTGANLEGSAVIPEQLAQCKSLKGATMPNGEKYEDWLKSKSSWEDRKSSDPS